MRLARGGLAHTAAVVMLAVLAGPAAPRADVPVETVGRVEALPQPPGDHWVWISDVMLRRSALLDVDRGAFLGMVSAGFLSPTLFSSQTGSELYLPETYYSRGSRGERTDVVTVYDAATIAPVGEIVIPPKRAVNVLPNGNAAVEDGGRYLAVLNMTPATSLSIVDLATRTFVTEVATPGCSLVYAAGPSRFLSLCADGSFLTVTVAEGGATRVERGPVFFDPQADPVTEKAVRYGDRWLFVSFGGVVHPLDVSGETPAPGETWSLLDEADRSASWRIGGRQHLAVHQSTGRLYSLVHQGGIDTHKDAGTDLWVYDLESRKRVQRIELLHPGFSFLHMSFEFSGGWAWLADWLLDVAIPNPGIESILVTQDDEPVLVTGTQIGGSLAVYDALSGEFLRRVSTGNMMVFSLQPFAPNVGAR
ncbi:MAG: amine dehydrogenase large subunit [Proteobacteria bacterium]|nr:amine dehydrogenase large subunit [Pseudomonadota bacterium]